MRVRRRRITLLEAGSSLVEFCFSRSSVALAFQTVEQRTKCGNRNICNGSRERLFTVRG